MRYQQSDLPREPTHCPRSECVYCVDGICDEPSINKGNGDAKCHRASNLAVLVMLGKPLPKT